MNYYVINTWRQLAENVYPLQIAIGAAHLLLRSTGYEQKKIKDKKKYSANIFMCISFIITHILCDIFGRFNKKQLYSLYRLQILYSFFFWKSQIWYGRNEWMLWVPILASISTFTWYNNNVPASHVCVCVCVYHRTAAWRNRLLCVSMFSNGFRDYL